MHVLLACTWVVAQVRLGYFRQPQSFLVGCARHLFDHEGVELGCFPQSSGSFAVSKLEEGQLDMAMVGSSPLAEAVARGVPLVAVYIALEDDTDQGLVVRPTILSPGQLRGKRIATPFTSTSHYQLLFLRQVFNIEAVEIINLSPSAIIEQWNSGAIDGAYIWGATYRDLLASNGRLLISSGSVARWDRATFQVLAVRREFAERNFEFVRNLVRVISLLDQSRRASDDNELNQRLVEQWGADLPAGFLTSVTDGMYRNASSVAARRVVASWMQPAPLPAAQLGDDILCGYLQPSCTRAAIPNVLTVLQTAQFLLEQKVLPTIQPSGRYFTLPAANQTLAEQASRSLVYNASFLLDVLPTINDRNLNALVANATLLAPTPDARGPAGSASGDDSTCAASGSGGGPTLLGAGAGLAAAGEVSEGAGASPGRSYSDSLNCVWTLLAGSAEGLVELNLTVGRIWSNDFLRVFEGNSTSGPLLATITGIDRWWPPLRAAGAMTIAFVTDANKCGAALFERATLRTGYAGSHSHYRPQ